MKTWNYDNAYGWLVTAWCPGPWNRPRITRGDGWVVLNTGRLNIGIGWHWPTRVPV